MWQRTLEVYDQAQQTGAATKTDTHVHLFEDGSIDFVLRIASALKAKPKGLAGSRYGCRVRCAVLPADVGPRCDSVIPLVNTRSDPKPGSGQQQPKQAPRNPFLPYEEDLWVAHLSDTHTLLLNKFNVVPHHVLVVTRQYESQQDRLNSRDLAATQQASKGPAANTSGWCPAQTTSVCAMQSVSGC
jgi:ATP adenylyltransferase/5',5'''-P-1,P-4-tetraphosphate phosphorylase II